MKVIDSKVADGLLVAKAALAATVGQAAVRMLTDARVGHLDDEPPHAGSLGRSRRSTDIGRPSCNHPL